LKPAPFRTEIPEAAIDDLKSRLRSTRLAEDFGNAGGRFGVEGGWLGDMIHYWAETFDWRAQEHAINAFAHYRAEIDDVPIHYIHAPGKGPDPIPILLTHGWPWTFWDWHRLIGPLSDPAAHGGDPADAFDVIVPSLPGFGFSAPLRRTDIGVRAIARLWVRLMREAAGHGRFIAAGGDWGSLVSAELGHAHPDHVLGVHLTLPLVPGLDPASIRPSDYAGDEQWMAERTAAARSVSRGHILAHRQSAQTLAYAFEDSPAGLAAWIWEKRRDWSDCGGEIERAFDRDFLCTTASLYWFTRTIGTSMRLYAADSGHLAPLHERRPTIGVPTAFAVAPQELLLIPRRVAAERTNLVRWTRLPHGGHFLPAEAPELLIQEYRAFARKLR
jgi:pimeloyl-ACP methyl ester carboxylesterase